MSSFTLRWLSKKCTLWRERAPIIVRSVKSQPSLGLAARAFFLLAVVGVGDLRTNPCMLPGVHSKFRRAPNAQAIFCRRRHQPRRPPFAKIRPGRPAPATGAGTVPTGTTQRGNVGNGPAKVRKCSVGPATGDGACAVLASGPICFVQIAQAQPKLSLSPTSRTLAAAPTGRQTAAKRRKTPRNAQDSCDVMRVDM